MNIDTLAPSTLQSLPPKNNLSNKPGTQRVTYLIIESSGSMGHFLTCSA